MQMPAQQETGSRSRITASVIASGSPLDSGRRGSLSSGAYVLFLPSSPAFSGSVSLPLFSVIPMLGSVTSASVQTVRAARMIVTTAMGRCMLVTERA